MFIKHLTNKTKTSSHPPLPPVCGCVCIRTENCTKAICVTGARIHKLFQQLLREGMARSPHKLVPGHSLTQFNSRVNNKEQFSSVWHPSLKGEGQLCSEKMYLGWELPADLTHQAHCAVLGASGCFGRLWWRKEVVHQWFLTPREPEVKKTTSWQKRDLPGGQISWLAVAGRFERAARSSLMCGTWRDLLLLAKDTEVSFFFFCRVAGRRHRPYLFCR